MSRKGSTQRPPVTSRSNGEPPPSTIAAQIVNNASNIHTQQEPSTKAVFAQLLQEYLSDPATDESSSQLNTQLVTVVAEEGLGGLLQDNPFATDALIPQAIDSIAVLKLTIQRRPQLLVSSRVEDEDGSPRPLLFIWLFPKLLALLGLSNLEPLRPCVQDFLVTCVRVLERKPELWPHKESLILLYRSCVDHILAALDQSESYAERLTLSIKAVLPPSTSISKFWPDSQQYVALPQGSQKTVTSRLQGLLIGLNLLKVISDILRSPRKVPSGSSFLDDLPWIIDCSSTLWRDFLKWHNHTELSQAYDRVMAMFMEVLESSCLSHATLDPCSFPSAKVALFLSNGLSELIQTCSTKTCSTENQIQLASLLTRARRMLYKTEAETSHPERRYRNLTLLFKDSFEPAIAQACESVARLNTLERDLQLAICLWTSPGEWPDEVDAVRAALYSDGIQAFSHEHLQEEYAPLEKMFRHLNVVVEERPAKRRKTDSDPDSYPIHDSHRNAYSQFTSQIRGMFQMSENYTESQSCELSNLYSCIENLYEGLPDEQRYAVLSNQGFGKIACAASGCLVAIDAHTSDWSTAPCKVCDDEQLLKRDPSIFWNTNGDGEAYKDTIASLMALTKNDKFQQSKKARVLLALTIRRIFNHISDPSYLNLSQSALGEWCISSLVSSTRELRIAAWRAIPAFLREDIPASIRGKNRFGILQLFQSFPLEKPLPVQETAILACGQVARACGEDELPIILFQLVEYLGHPNALLGGVAYNELSSLPELLDTNLVELLRPFWGSIGVSVVKDIQKRPQKAQRLADLLGMDVTSFLLMTQTETLPHLVLTKRKDILQRIASARRTTVQDICLQPRKNLANILAILLSQPVDNVENAAVDALKAVSPSFQSNHDDLAEWVKLEPVLTACGMLKTAAEDESRRRKIRNGFQTLAVLAERGGPRRPTSKKKTLSAFFEAHILGIMQHFSDVLDNPHEKHPITERKRCVGAIGQMISLADHHVSIALPQIRSCLQSAMMDSNLCDQTFSVWSTLLSAVEEEDIDSLVDQTFALITQNWDSFSPDTHKIAYETIQRLIKDYNPILRERIDSLPSLGSISMLSKFENEISRLRANVEPGHQFATFSRRCEDENALVVHQALVELIPFLETHQSFLHDSATSQKPSSVLSSLARSLLDACVRFADDITDIPILSARCLGLMGCLDPYRVETVREKRKILVLSNFERATEVVNFTAFLLEQILVPVFHSTTNARAQGFLAYVMQELLKFCSFNQVDPRAPRASQSAVSDAVSQRWYQIPESIRSTLTPFLSSKYMIRTSSVNPQNLESYPIFSRVSSHAAWLRAFVYDLLQRGRGDNAKMIFTVLARIIKAQDLSIANFILPFAALNVIVSGDDQETVDVGLELLAILQADIQSADSVTATYIKQCSENVFHILDYISLWQQEKRKESADARALAGKTGRGINEVEEIKAISQISCIERILQTIPAEVISKRAVECGSYARALFHWEQYIRQEQQKAQDKEFPLQTDALYRNLQSIYAQIDEPDSIEGISAHLNVLSPEQQVMEHRKAGRWTAAQSWYELSLAERPNDTETQINLLTCLKESGQYDSILNYIEGFHSSTNQYSPETLPFAAEAAWSTGKWDQLQKILASPAEQLASSQDFNVGIGRALLSLRQKEIPNFRQLIASLREGVAKSMSPSTTTSLHASHDHLLKLHVLYELEAISGITSDNPSKKDVVLDILDQRLEVLGAYTSDKQYLLGIRRATMQLSKLGFTNLDIASAWLVSARLARKADFSSTAFNSVLHATQLGDDGSKIEYSKLLWKDGHHRKAIQNLEGAIASNAFQSQNAMPVDDSVTTTVGQPQQPNKLKAHAQLTLTKWLDRAGQTKSGTLKELYAAGLMAFPKWDKGHYFLGRHYLNIMESEKLLPEQKQTLQYVAGELSKHVIENFIRSVVYGTKYYYQTIPKIITLWLDLGMQVSKPTPRHSNDREITEYRSNFLSQTNKLIKRYTKERMPSYAWYIAFSQIITRVSHPHADVWDVLSTIVLRVTSFYPQQALWSLLAVTKSTNKFRADRGLQALHELKGLKKPKNVAINLNQLILHGQRLSEALLSTCEAPLEPRVSHVGLQKDLGFNHKLAPCALVVPIEATMIVSLPTGHDSRVIRSHNPFPHDAITIQSFNEDVLVLSSLQRPRKLTIRGSDGRSYGLMCKPKDDLRKDQRLMEFNAVINRALQRDIGSSKRRLDIKTYGVTPLNEECGIIEWVEGLKPMRDIIIRLYRQKGVSIDYAEIRMLLNEVCSAPDKIGLFTEKILQKFPAVLYEWFIETFPEPEAWFAARLRYTRSCAVMSIVGHALGLGDRHGENVLLEEGNGGTFHVDFNCLFDKGLTFEKPELVPFRLTHNMVDAMGPQGIEGPFRTAAELTYAQLRQHEDTLITVLETFVHDPTADFLDKKKRRKIAGVPDTPQEVLESVHGKLAGLLRGETVPLSVEGYVQAMIQMARDPKNLAAMYIGWCAFF